MFGAAKPPFGQTAGAFGSFNTTTSPFGQSAFGKPATTGFGSGAFGTAQPQAGQPTGGLFGQPQPSQPTGGLFGQQAQPSSAFGPATTQSGFGFGQNQSTGLFSSTANTGSTMFGQPAAQPFGAKPQGFGFGPTSTSGGLFGSTTPAATGLFGQTATPTAGTSGLFGGTTSFGVGAAQQSGSYLKYGPVSGTDVMVKNGHTQNISTLHHCITCMKEYETKSLEELRFEDYLSNRRGGATGTIAGGTSVLGGGNTTGSVFGQAQPQGGLFGQGSNTFGQTNTAFGQPSTSTTGGLFGKPATTGFGAQPATGAGYTFGVSTTNPSTGLFGAAKPFSSGLFGAPTTQAQPAPFSTQPSQGFGTMGAPQQTNSLFGAKPPENTGFGLGQNNQAASAFGTGSVFGAPAATAASGGLFGAKPFGSTAPTFAAPNSAFGAPASNTAGGGLFGNTAFGAKPATTGAPPFGAFNTPTTNTGLTGGMNFGGGSLFNQKPAGTGLFGTTGTNQQPSLFGNTGTGMGMGTGLGTGTTGFGAGTVGFPSSGLGTTGLGTGGLGTTNNMSNFGSGGLLGGNSNSLQLGGNNNLLGGIQSPPSGNIHEQMIALASKPFGHSPLLKDLVPSPGKEDDTLRPTNPIAQKAVLENDKYKVSPGVPRLRIKPFSGATPLSKKSLFDGLEENDPSVQESFTAKRNVKRLILRPKPSDNNIAGRNLQAIEGPENQSITDADTSVDITRFEDASVGSMNRSGQHSREPSPGGSTNIQKRVGFNDSRGSTAKSPLQISSSANTSKSDSDRRSSWLTTKPLNKWPNQESDQAGSSTSVMANIIGSSSSPSTSVVSQLDSTIDQLLPARTTPSSGRLYPSLKKQGLIGDVETLDNDTQEERDKENTVPHPTGIKLNRPGYYTIPSMDELVGYIRPDGSCIVPQFTVGRRGYGNVFFDCEMDVANLDLDEIVHIMNKEIIVYSEDDNKPEVGKGLNRKAQVTLDKVWPKDKTFMVPITDPERLALMDYESKLRRACDKIGTKFIEYRPQTGSWVFKVQHFSKYGLPESDDEDDGLTDIQKMKQQLLLQQHQGKGGLNAKSLHPAAKMSRGLGGDSMQVGLGGGSIPYDDDHSLDDNLFTARTSTTNKGLAMDTSEENSVDTIIFYPEGNTSESKDVLSPVSHAHLKARNSHTLQLMKASFYNMDNDDAGSVTDQLVPQVASTTGSVSNMSVRLGDVLQHAQQMDSTTLLVQESVKHEPFVQSGVEIKAPIIKPQTVMLKFHKHVMPFRKTIAGRMGASPYTDLSIANARLFRVGWGRGSQLTSLSTLDSTTDTPLSGGLPTLGEYLKGRCGDDGSAVVTQRMKVAGGGPPTDMGLTFKESIEPHLEIILKHSKLVFPSGDSSKDDHCPLIVPDADRCLAAAKLHLQEDIKLASRDAYPNFGVNPTYWKQVWSLCLALWDKHLEEDSDLNVPNGERLLSDHAALSDWLEEVNGHICGSKESQNILDLLSANKIAEACMQCQSEKNYIAAAILTQIKGDLNIRSLAYNQLATWHETNSDSHIPHWFLSILSLSAGKACAVVDDKGTLLHTCEGLSWIQALALHYWYLCDPVATISDALAAFQHSFWEDTKHFSTNQFNAEPTLGDAEMDENNQHKDLLYAEQVDIDKSRVAYPFPPYTDEAREECKKQMLDLRFQLMSLKASKWTSLDSIVNPASHTPDPLDYRLSWCLQQFLEGLGYSHWSQNGLACLITGFASQLEAHGMWLWSIFVLQHISNDDLRNTAVKDMLMRHAGTTEVPIIRKHLERLGLPGKWLHQAEAQLAHYKNDPENEVRHLTLATRYIEAHQVILDKLAPTYILNENAEALRRVLQPLIRPGNEGVIPHWNSGGHLFLEFMDIWDEVKSLVGLDWGEFSYKCEVLKKRIASACTAISGLATPTLKHTVARWEVAARLAQVGCAVVGDPDTGRVTKSSVRPLLSIISSLDLPPDYTRLQLDKFIKSFTEEEVPC